MFAVKNCRGFEKNPRNAQKLMHVKKSCFTVTVIRYKKRLEYRN